MGQLLGDSALLGGGSHPRVGVLSRPRTGDVPGFPEELWSSGMISGTQNLGPSSGCGKADESEAPSTFSPPHTEDGAPPPEPLAWPHRGRPPSGAGEQRGLAGRSAAAPRQTSPRPPPAAPPRSGQSAEGLPALGHARPCCPAALRAPPCPPGVWAPGPPRACRPPSGLLREARKGLHFCLFARPRYTVEKGGQGGGDGSLA